MATPIKSTTYSILVVVVSNRMQQAGVLFTPVWERSAGLSPMFVARDASECAALSVGRVAALQSALKLEGDAQLGTFFVRQTQFRGAMCAVVCTGVLSLEPLGRKFLPLRLRFPVSDSAPSKQMLMNIVLSL